MRTFQKIALALVLVACIALIIIFWGSIFSILMTLAVIFIPGIYLYNRFINTDETSDFTDDMNGWQ